MANNSVIRVEDMKKISAGMGEVNDARFLKNADKGALATLDEVTKTQLGAALKTEIEGKANSSTTLSGYGITDAYTKSEVDGKISSAYKAKGRLAPEAILPALLVAGNEGNVYDIAGEFTTTADFIEGAGNKHPAGSNIAVINTAASDEAAVYKFDVLPCMVDLSNYATKDEVTAATTEDIAAIVAGTYPSSQSQGE